MSKLSMRMREYIRCVGIDAFTLLSQVHLIRDIFLVRAQKLVGRNRTEMPEKVNG